jgi:homeobox protein cut-like
LASKNKKLSGQVTQFKTQLDESLLKYNELQSNWSLLQKENIKQKDLILKLESDLHSSTFNASVTPYPSTDLERLITGGLVGHANNKFNKDKTESTQQDMLSILASQRDRYKLKNEELETLLKQQNSSFGHLENKLNQLQSDNIKLYEKLKYMESFSSKTLVNPQKSHSFTDYIGISFQPTEPDVTKKYRPLYEQSLDPFQHFHQQVSPYD